MRYLFGKWTPADAPLSATQAMEIARTANAQAAELAQYPLEKIFDLLQRVGQVWSDKNYPGYRSALEQLPHATGFSKEMVELGLNELPRLFNAESLRRKVRTELRGRPPTGEQAEEYGENVYSKNAYGDESELFWQPLGVLLHVLAGNVFLGGPGSLLEGLITKNVTILKMSSAETIFLPLLLRSFEECDHDGVVCRSIAVIDYQSSQSDVINAFKSQVDGIVVWGGEQAVKAYRENLPVHTRLIAFGPKLSFAWVTAAGLDEHGIAEVARGLAMSLSIWDQNACTAPQVVYVEGETGALALAKQTAARLEEMSASLPAGPADLQTAVEIRKLRTVFEINEAKGHGRLFQSTKDLSFTIVVDHDTTLEPSPLHRTVRIVPLEKRETVLGEVRKLKGFIQSVGLTAASHEQTELTYALARAGAVRVVEIGSMAGGAIDDPHDGQYDLPQLVNFVFSRLKNGTTNARLRKLIEKARHAPFYSERLKNLSVETVRDLRKISILTRQDMEANMPPAGSALQTSPGVLPFTGGYVSRSGGSTGEPKYSIYDGHDWEQMISQAVPMFHALGLRRGDRLANCFVAGDLYGSFVSFDHINVRVGVTTFAFGGKVDPDFFVHTYRRFRFNAIQGIPASLMPLLRAAKQLEPELHLEKLIYAGAPLSAADRRWLHDELGIKRIASVIGANDGGQFAYQCEHLSGAFHHVVDDFNYVELVDDNGETVPDGSVGRLLITSLLKYAYPLIRYDIGDKARFVVADGTSSCPCGSQRRILEYLGRSDDIFSIGLLNFSYRDCTQALSDLPISETQVIATADDDGVEHLIIRLESTAGGKDLEGLIFDRLVSRLEKLGQRIAEKVLRVTVEVVPLGSLPRNPRTGKIKQVIDERL